MRANDGQLPRVVIDSTGHAAVFAEALGLAADRGTLQALDSTANRELGLAVLLADWAGGLDDIKGSPLADTAWGNT